MQSYISFLINIVKKYVTSAADEITSLQNCILFNVTSLFADVYYKTLLALNSIELVIVCQGILLQVSKQLPLQA